MFYLLTGGSHEEDGKKYMKGDIIESKNNLVSMFRGKFKKVSEEGGIPKSEKTPDIPTKKTIEKLKEKTIETRLGPDVTVSFLEAKGTGFKVHKAAEGKYHVVDSKSDVYGGVGFTRNEVIIFLNNA